MRKWLLLGLFATLAQMTFAQIELRPQVGYNSSSFTTDLPLGSFDADQGLQFGVDLMIGNRFYVQPGLFWESTRNSIDTGDEDKLAIKINRVRLPLLVGYRLLDPGRTGRYFNLRLFTGPNASFSVNREVEENGLAFGKDDIAGSVFGWNAGLGLDLAILFLDAGYTFGLSEVFRGLESSPRNNLFYLNGGVRIRF